MMYRISLILSLVGLLLIGCVLTEARRRGGRANRGGYDHYIALIPDPAQMPSPMHVL